MMSVLEYFKYSLFPVNPDLLWFWTPFHWMAILLPVVALISFIYSKLSSEEIKEVKKSNCVIKFK